MSSAWATSLGRGQRCSGTVSTSASRGWSGARSLACLRTRVSSRRRAIVANRPRRRASSSIDHPSRPSWRTTWTQTDWTTSAESNLARSWSETCRRTRARRYGEYAANNAPAASTSPRASWSSSSSIGSADILPLPLGEGGGGFRTAARRSAVAVARGAVDSAAGEEERGGGPDVVFERRHVVRPRDVEIGHTAEEVGRGYAERRQIDRDRTRDRLKEGDRRLEDVLCRRVGRRGRRGSRIGVRRGRGNGGRDVGGQLNDIAGERVTGRRQSTCQPAKELRDDGNARRCRGGRRPTRRGRTAGCVDFHRSRRCF